jgi:hypothetical protein
MKELRGHAVFDRRRGGIHGTAYSHSNGVIEAL